MFKSHELVVKLEKIPKRKRIDDVEMDVESPSEAKPGRFDRLDIEMLAQQIFQDVVAAYFCIKGFKTLCSAVEHIVVTKVK